MEKKSSVYVNITDRTYQTGGTQELRPIIPMFTTKGEIGLNRVTAQNFKDIVGYDIDYNSNYLGLSKILDKVTYAYVWRLNQGASFGNKYWNGSALTSSEITNKNQLSAYDFYVTQKTVGDIGDKGFQIIPRKVEYGITNTIKTSTDTITKTIDDLSTKSRVSEFEGYDDYVSFENAYGDIIGIVKTSDKKIYRVSNGQIGEQVGSMSGSTVTITKPLSSDASWIAKYYSTKFEEWTLRYGDFENSTLLNYESYDFSLNRNSDIYIENVSFGDIIVHNNGILNAEREDKFAVVSKLDNANNGVDEKDISVAEVDFSFFKTARCNFLFTNGLTNTALINGIIANATPYRTHVFVGTPDYASYFAVKDWVEKIHGNAYTVIISVTDNIPYKDSYISICPSVKYCEVYANMLENYGSLNYPPAGHTYGKVSANELRNTDFDYYGNELKTDRINYVTSDSNGVCIWEQRTMNAEVTDLSYVAPTFILDDLQDQLVSFERNFNFRYQSGSDLLLQEEGLTSILNSFKTKGFLYDYELTVPSVAEANESRELDIYIGVQITRDSEIINLNITLNN